MESDMRKAEGSKEISYESYVVRKSLEDYWRADEKVDLVWHTD